MALIEELDSVTIHVKDLPKARRFYGEVLGLRELPAGAERLLFALPGGARLLMHVQRPEEQGRPAGTITGIMLRVRDGAQAEAEVRKRGGHVVDGAWKAPWGPTYVTIADPDGNELLLIQRDAPLPSA